MEKYGDTGWGRIAISNNYDAQLCSLPAGKHRNEMRNYINSVEQTFDCRIYSVEDEEVQDYLRSRELCGNAIRPYKKLTKKSFTR